MVEFPIWSIVRNVPRLPNLSTRYRGAQSFWTHPYEPQQAHLHRQHSPIQDTTQGFLIFIHHPEPQVKRCHSQPQHKECHVFPLYLEPQLKGYVPRHNLRNNPASLSLMYHQNLVDHAHPKQTRILPLFYSLALL